MYENVIYWGLERWLIVKGTGCSCQAPEFNSQYPHSDSQLSIVESDAFFWHKVDRALLYIK